MGHEFLHTSGWWLFCLLIVSGICLYMAFSRKKNGANESPADILKKRYARGEITKQQFEEMKKDLAA